jgi:hypothetical protein
MPKAKDRTKKTQTRKTQTQALQTATVRDIVDGLEGAELWLRSLRLALASIDQDLPVDLPPILVGIKQPPNAGGCF